MFTLKFTTKELKILHDLRIKSRAQEAKKRKCYNPNCNNKDLIKSHVTQKKVLKEIANRDNKVIQLKSPHYFERKKDNGKMYKFEKTGITNDGAEGVITFFGFCKECDNKIFEPIESGNVDYSLYKNQVLFSYRGFLNELYKNEVGIINGKLLNSSTKLKNEINKRTEEERKNFWEDSEHIYQYFKKRVENLENTKKLLESDVYTNTQNFEFIYFSLPKIEICTSAIFSAIMLGKKDNGTFEKILELASSINLIPDGVNTHVILGSQKRSGFSAPFNAEFLDKGIKLMYLQDIIKYSDDQKRKLISDVLIKYCESWVVSESLYNKWKQNKNFDEEILNKIHEYLPPQNKFNPIDFNIFCS